MHVLTTAVALALMTLAIILLGVFWLRVPRPLRLFLIRASVVIIVVHILFTATKWGTTSDRLNVIVKWLGIASYEMLLMLFARLPPRWLTSISAFILMLPVFASSILMPLTLLFDPATYPLSPIDTDFAYQRIPWTVGEGSSEISGVQLSIYYRPHFLPFLRQERQAVFFNDQQCDSSKAWISAGPRPKTIQAHCPHWPSQAPGSEEPIYPLP